MRARTSLILVTGVVLGAALATRRFLSLLGVISGRPLWGYGVLLKRPQVAAENLRRSTAEEQSEAARELLGRLVKRIKAKYDHDAADGRKEPPTVDILIISGGGDWGAFGAGFLKGWQKLAVSHPLAMPEFDAVTGVSTGTLIAPFAFLGDEQSIEEILNMYRNPKKDWAKQRGYLYFLPDNISFAAVPGLEREIRKHITVDMLARITKAGADGRLLLVNTTELDVGQPRVFDLVAEAQRAADSAELERVHNIMLASAGIPGAFPFRMIDGELYVDGGVTANIIYGGRIAEEDSLPALWQEAYPNHHDPKFRFWVIFNNQFRPVPKLVAPYWPAVIQRSLETSTRAATATAVRHLFAMAEISRLKRKADVEVRLVSIPGDWIPPAPTPFDKETMNNLADLGEKMGADPASWSSEPRESPTAQHVS
ncbi:MAG TPA: patatin-like phospholipase family protein [Candidatus Binatia bacterium]|nr:patatin-like phospholipase family protein [Candidatus Binatia bacterium]